MVAITTKMTPAERHKILVEWNNTFSPYNKNQSLAQLFEEHASSKANEIAVYLEQQTLTFGALNERANQLAHYLEALGVRRKSLVALCLPPSLDLMVAIIAILKAGGGYIPLDPNNPRERQGLILKDTEACALITTSHFAPQFRDQNAGIICTDTCEVQLREYPKYNPKASNEPSDSAYVIYTSGSTGQPKGVQISQKNVLHFIHWFQLGLEVQSDDIFDFSSSIAFDFSVATTLFPLLAGAKVRICNETIKKDPYLYFNYLTEYQPNIIKLTPSYFRQLKEIALQENKPLPLKYIVFGGELLFANDIADWLETYPEHIMFCEYGPTEASVATSWLKVTAHNLSQFKYTIPIGKPCLNSKLYILDQHQEPVQIGELGELYIGGDGIAQGYLNRPDLTSEKFISNPFDAEDPNRIYKTGDLCRYLSDGNIEFVERVDHQVKIRGFRIEIGEIENCLTSHPAIKEAAVIARDIPNSEKQLVAYCVPDKKVNIGIYDLRIFLQKHLPDYMVPVNFVLMESFPLNNNGKLDRKKLPEVIYTPIKSLEHNLSSLEMKLKDIWLNALHINQISVNDHFFDLGGHSLSAARIITKIRKELKKEIRLEDFYACATISNLANHINNIDEISDDMTLKTTYPTVLSSKIIPLNELQFLFWLAKLFYPAARFLNVVSRKRVPIKIDAKALNYALNHVKQKHTVLCYKISHLRPIQFHQTISNIHIIEKDIGHLSLAEQEDELIASLDALESFAWKKNCPLIEVRLFHLSDTVSEFHFAMSHFVSDEISKEILMEDISKYYLDYKNKVRKRYPTQPAQYIDYILEEKNHLKTALKKNIVFWEEYLKETALLRFPQEKITYNMNSSCTTTLEIPEKSLIGLKSFCIQNKLNIANSLCAIIGYTLSPYVNSDNKTVILNFIRSTRENEIYDKSIGLFVRTDVIKIDLNQPSDLIELSKQVQNTIASVDPYQACPVIVKLACLMKKHWQHKKLRNIFINLIAFTYAKLLPKAKLNSKVLSMFGRVLIGWNKNHFVVDVNIMNSFILNNANTAVFGVTPEQVKPNIKDKIINQGVLNIWFDRDSQNKAYLILSGNLIPEFRQELGKQIIDGIRSCQPELSPSPCPSQN